MIIMQINKETFLILLIPFLVSLLLVPAVKKLAIHIGAVDKPNKRRLNKVAKPTQGGLAIFAAFVVGMILYLKPSYQMTSILIGGFLLIITGIVDGIKSISARYKFVAQMLAASVVVFYGGIYFNDITILGLTLNFGALASQIISVIFIVAIINAINLIDGLDGLCSGISSIYFITITIISVMLGQSNGLDITLSLIMLGSTLGFLVHNFPPASIFLGDTGSMFIGYMISVIALLGFKMATFTSLVVPLVMLAIPIFDTLSAIIRRKLKGESIAKADKEHFHHQLLKMKFSPRTTVLIIYMINILFAIVSILFSLGFKELAIIIYILLMLFLLYIILKTNILFDNKK